MKHFILEATISSFSSTPELVVVVLLKVDEIGSLARFSVLLLHNKVMNGSTYLHKPYIADLGASCMVSKSENQ